jgi:hypothetical protein
MNPISIPNQVRKDLADTIEEIGQAMGLLREADDDLSNGNDLAAAMSASDALEIISGLETTYSSLAARLAVFSEN